MKHKKYPALFTILASAIILCGTALTASAEGSKDLINSAAKNGYRPYLEWNSATNLGMHRKNIVYVYAQEGETIYFGSSCYAEDESSVKAIFSDDPNDVNKSFSDNVGPDKGIGVAVMLPAENDTPKSPGINSSYQIIDSDSSADLINADADTVYLFSIDRNGKGHIATVDEESAGPNVQAQDGYEPLSFTAPKTGTYAFRFLSKNYSSSEVSQPSILAEESELKEANGTIAAFDISVYNDNMLQSGRVWNDVLFLNTGENEAEIYSSFYVLTDDGFQYKVDTNGMQPYGVVFYSNRRGFLIDPDNSYTNSIGTDNPDYNNLQPLMHSFFSREGNTANVGLPPKVNGNTVYANYTPTDPNVDKNYKLFFNEPSAEALEAYTGKNELTDSKDISQDSDIAQESKLTYTGSGPNTNEANIASDLLGGGTESFGGTFKLELDVTDDLPDDFAVVLDFSSYKLDSKLNPVLGSDGTWETADSPDQAESANILSLTGHKTIENGNAVYTVIWDGRDTYNNIVPAGTYTSIVREYFVYGSMHLPLIDVEGMPNGIKIELMNNVDYSNEWFGSRDAHTVYYNNDNSDGTYGTYKGNPAVIGDGKNASTGSSSENGALCYDFDDHQYTALDIWSDYFYPVGKAYTIEVLPVGNVSGPYLSYVKESADTNTDNDTFSNSHIKTPSGETITKGYGSSEDSDVNYGNTISTGFVATIKTSSDTAFHANDILWVINIPDPQENDLYLKIEAGNKSGTFNNGNPDIQKEFTLGDAIVEDSNSVDVNSGNIYKVEQFDDGGSAMLLLLDSFPDTTISGGCSIDYGIVIDNIYAPHASAKLKLVDENATYSMDIRSEGQDNIHSNETNEYETSSNNSYFQASGTVSAEQ